MEHSEDDQKWMQVALDIAANGRGSVEPNPMVGCVIVRDGKELSRGYHEKFGQNHAEVNAIENYDSDPAGATAYVTLEPCCHQGKTPPCVDRLIESKIARVVIADGDPFPQVHGGGIEKLRQAGIQVDVGLLQHSARELNAPYLKRINHNRPWVIAKWAMTLDGKIATQTGDSKWISTEASRQIVHEIRGRMDAIIVGSQTVIADDPMLTARPAGQRVPLRVVVDSNLKTEPHAKLVQTAKEVPTMFVAAENADASQADLLEQAGCELFRVGGSSHQQRLNELLDELGRRKFTNVLIEGGAELLGGFFDIQQVDEVHVFIGNRLVGGDQALTAVRGQGIQQMADALTLAQPTSQIIGDDVYIHGRISRS